MKKRERVYKDKTRGNIDLTFRRSEGAKSQTSRRRCYLTKKSKFDQVWNRARRLVFSSAAGGRKVVTGWCCGDIRGLFSSFPLVTLIAKHHSIVVYAAFVPCRRNTETLLCWAMIFLSFPVEWRFYKDVANCWPEEKKVIWPFARHLLESIRMADANNLRLCLHGLRIVRNKNNNKLADPVGSLQWQNKGTCFHRINNKRRSERERGFHAYVMRKTRKQEMGQWKKEKNNNNKQTNKQTKRGKNNLQPISLHQTPSPYYLPVLWLKAKEKEKERAEGERESS